MRSRPLTLLFLVAAVAGFFFASMSTMDFVQFLDRQTHAINCTFTPGISALDASGTSDCHVTLMSPYSSVLRASVWGGVPISLAAMSVFAFLIYRGLDLLLNQREAERGTTGFLAFSAALPFLTSLVMGYLSLVELDAACKLCIGIYSSSTIAFVSAVVLWRLAVVPRLGEPIGLRGEPAPTEQGLAGHVASFFTGVGFVVVPVLVYLIAMPSYDKYVGSCGGLVNDADPNGVMVPVGQQVAGVPAIELFDPLCPSCRAFEKRLEAAGLDQRIKRKAVMFPLDSSCNWMVPERMHPGACEVSMAVLCAGDKADGVVEWAFENQAAIKTAAEKDGKAATAMVNEKFPDLKACMGDPKTITRLRKSMKWAVDNQLEVLTPQLFVNGQKLCDADTDLGMDYMLTQLLAKGGATAPTEAP